VREGSSAVIFSVEERILKIIEREREGETGEWRNLHNE
jgi:hypothetical protein